MNLTENISQYTEEIEKLKTSIFKDDFKNRNGMYRMTFSDGSSLRLAKGRALINLIIFRIFKKYNLEIVREYVISDEFITQDVISNYLNNIVFMLEGKKEYSEIREIIAEILNELSDISGSSNIKHGNTISFADFVELGANDPEAYAAFNPKFGYGLQFPDIERLFSEKANEVINVFKNHPETDLFPFITSESGINKKQFGQVTSFISFKPDINGNTIPVNITDSFLKGISNVENYLIVAKGARKALTQNSTYTKRSGYLTRKLSLTAIDTFTDETEDCGTKHFIRYNISNKKKLKSIQNRHYYLLDESGNKIDDTLYTVTKDSEELIGKTIGLRSPITCCGKRVCKTCYGKRLAEINSGKNTGLIAVNKLTEPLTQRLLSSKHLLATKTDKINWGEEFEDIFITNLDTICFNGTDATIVINCNDIRAEDEDSSEFKVKKFIINKKEYTSPVSLYVNPSILSLRDKEDDTITVYSDDYGTDTYLFRFIPKNNEMTKSLQQILDLLESADHLGIKTIDDFVNKFIDLLIENDLSWIQSVHTEMISRKLFVTSESKKLIDFTQDEIPDYEIVRVSKSILNSPISVSLSFERISEQLSDIDTYSKNDSSIMDFLFK